MPLFARYQVESYLSAMFNPTVQLKSGGYIVIGVTEALVAIDVNSGRATKEGSIEETALKTNLEAAEEVARQLRLRDLAGLIVIDFIDMDERRNNAAVEKRMKDRLKTDRARIQVGRISGFGLMEMSRQRLRPGMIEATTQPCPACHGTGLIRSDDNLALSILRQIEEEGVRRRSREVLVKCPVGIANYLMNQKREHVAQIEARYGLSVRVEGDPMLVSPDFSLEKFKTATRFVPEATAPVVSVDSSLMDEIDEDEARAEEAPAAEAEGEEPRPKKRRRRRRRKPKSQREAADAPDTAETTGEEGEGSGSQDAAEGAPAEEAPQDAQEAQGEPDAQEAAPEEAPKPKRTRRKPTKKAADKADAQADAETPSEDPVAEAPAAEEAEEPEAKTAKPKKKATRTRRKKAEPVAAEPETAEAPQTSEAPAEAAADAPAEAQPEAPVMVAEPEPEPATAAAEDAPGDPDKPKRRGWWAIGR